MPSSYLYIYLALFCCDVLIVGEYVLLHFMNPIGWLASQTLVVFLHPGDQLFKFFSLPRSHRVGGLKQARWRWLVVAGNVVMVLSAVGDAAMVKAGGDERGRARYVTLRSPSLNKIVE